MESDLATTITRALPKDAAEIAALVNSAYRGASSRQGWTTEADYLDGQRTDAGLIFEELQHPQRLILCLRRKSLGSLHAQLLGLVLLERMVESNACYLGMLTTRPDFQNAGLGKRLMAAGEQQARDWGCKEMHLNVVSRRDTLIAWYERHGYRDTGETQPFPYGQEQFGIPKVEGLHFRIFKKSLGSNDLDIGL